MEKKDLTINEVEFREQLRIQFLVSTLMIPLKKVAAILGLPESTLRQYVGEGRFFLPHRRISRTIMVDVDDLVAWYCTGQCKQKAGTFENRLKNYRESRAAFEAIASEAISTNNLPSPESIIQDACHAHGVSHQPRRRAPR